MKSSRNRGSAAKPAGLATFVDMFKVGVGPSSSHTTGPMVAARRFALALGEGERDVAAVVATLHGSLAWTGAGHWTDKAVTLGLGGAAPETLTPEAAKDALDRVRAERRLTLPAGATIPFDMARDVKFDRRTKFERHPNAMTFEAFAPGGASLRKEVWYSVGGGFVEREGDPPAAAADAPS
ncbi:MAG: hypothetical protein KGI57_07860, partial [Hyphomicrobiales bacterium]|nr:hypothetical protein [Hyphomicrobiales bacterium]